MRNAARRQRWMIFTAALIIAAALVFYALLAYDWLQPSRLSRLRLPSRKTHVSAALHKARAGLRASFLDPAAHIRLAEALYESARPIDAFYVLYGARALFGDAAFKRAHALVMLYRGRHFLGLADFDPSPANESDLKSRLQRDPKDAAAREYLAHIAAAQGRPGEAISLLDQGLAARPAEPGLLYYRAVIATGDGDGRTAVPLWVRLLSKHPGTFYARSAWEELGRMAQRPPAASDDDPSRLAMAALLELRQPRADDPRAFSTLALAVWGRGDLPGVRALAAEALAQDPQPAGADMIAGALALNDRAPDQALRRFAAAWAQDPADLYSAAKLAQLHFKQRAERE
ncbi:MAG: hypothetical protein WC881_10480, partial [Elusimicrobiota bacterium]